MGSFDFDGGRGVRKILVATALAVALSGCGKQAATSEETSESLLAAQVVELKAENTRLKAENAELRITPTALLAEVTKSVQGRNLAEAESVLAKLSAKFPDSGEAQSAAKLVGQLRSEEAKQVQEAARLAALGFKGLPTAAKFTNADSTIQLRSAATSSRWIFDAYGNEWRYIEAEKGTTFITAKVTVSSEDKDPRLMGMAAYVAVGAQLKRLGSFEYRFARWDDYASYLGNDADYRNDFAHSSNIPFSLAATVSKDEMKGDIYLVATKEGCFTRSEDRFKNPPVWYYTSTCASLPRTLSLDDFREGDLAVLKRM